MKFLLYYFDVFEELFKLRTRMETMRISEISHKHTKICVTKYKKLAFILILYLNILLCQRHKINRRKQAKKTTKNYKISSCVSTANFLHC